MPICCYYKLFLPMPSAMLIKPLDRFNLPTSFLKIEGQLGMPHCWFCAFSFGTPFRCPVWLQCRRLIRICYARPLLNSLVRAPALESTLCSSCKSGDKPRTTWRLSKSSASEPHSSLTESFFRHVDIRSVCSADQWWAPFNETIKAGITTSVWYNGSVLSSNFWMTWMTWTCS